MTAVDPFTVAFARRLYDLRCKEMVSPSVTPPAFASLPKSTRDAWIEHAGAVHAEYGLALQEALRTLGTIPE